MGITSWKDATETAYVKTVSPISITASDQTVNITMPTTDLASKSEYYVGKLLFTLGRNTNIQVKNGSSVLFNTSCSTSTKVNNNTYARATWAVASKSINTNNLFSANNPTVKIVPLKIVLPSGGYMNVTDSSGGTYIYTNTNRELGVINVTLNAPPTFDVGNLTFNTPGWIYAGLTTASVDVSNLSAKYGGYITSAVLKVGNYQSEPITTDGTLSLLLSEVGTDLPVSVIVTDSRGQVKEESLGTITVLGYSLPSVNLSVQRTLVTGAPADEGTYAVVSAQFTFTDAIATLQRPIVTGGSNVTWYKIRNAATGELDLQSEVNWTNTSSISSGDILYALVGTFEPDDSYIISVQPVDSEGTGVAQSVTLPTAFYTIDFLAGGHGIAFGMPSEEEGFFCNMDAHFKDKANVMRALLDLAHPKGSTYGTVLPPTINGHSYDDGNLTDADIEACGDTWFDPRIMWGGTWEKLPEGYILLSGSESGSYQVGTDSTSSGYKEYGANTKNITVSNMPSHDHAVNESDSKYFLTVDKSPDNAVARRTIKNGTGSSLQYNLYSENAITRTSATGSRGSGSAFNVMQKSIAVYTWIRTS